MIDDPIPNKAGNLLAHVTGRRAKGMLHILQPLKSLPISVPGNIHNKKHPSVASKPTGGCFFVWMKTAPLEEHHSFSGEESLSLHCGFVIMNRSSMFFLPIRT